MATSRDWLKEAIRRIETDFNRSADTHLFRFDLPGVPKIFLYLKDESTHPTGSLKHRLARSLFLYGLCSGWIERGTTIVEASSGSTAISEAYFASLLDLPFVAVIPRNTSPEKIAQIEFYGGRVHTVDSGANIYAKARDLARETGGHFMDQFTYAERVTDWRGNNNVAETIFAQLGEELHPVPRWVVCSAGTGGTSATIGRFARWRRLDTRLCVVDPERSVFYNYYRTGDASLTCSRPSRIEGIGRPRVEPSFVRSVVDRMIRVPDAASLAAIRFLHRTFGRRYGGSTGTNLYGALRIIAEMHRQGQEGSVVTLICDSGERYLGTYYNDDWVAEQGLEIETYLETLERFYATGEWLEPEHVPQ
jgi:cysteine synthase